MIQNSLVYLVSPQPTKFTKTTLFYSYSTLPAREQQSFLLMILAPGHQSLLVVDTFPVPTFK